MKETFYINLIYAIVAMLCFVCKFITHDNFYSIMGWMFNLMQIITLIISRRQNKKLLQKIKEK